MNMYKVTYKGNATRFKDFLQIVVTPTERMAVEKVYFQHLDNDYFPDDQGNICIYLKIVQVPTFVLL